MREYLVVETLGKNRVSDDLFDETAGYDDEVGVRFAPGLTPIEIKQAAILYNLFNELWGVCLVVGDPGTGKDLFGNYLTYRLKRYFPWKRILRDEKPRRLYGPYAGLFNEEVLTSELSKMRELAKGASAVKIDEVLEQAADDWVTGAGQVMLKNSVLYLTEYWRYCYNREPHNPMNKTMGGIHKVKRHIDCLIIGTGQLSSELDKKTCLPWIDWRVTCTHSKVNKTGFTYFVEKVKYDRRMDMLSAISKPFSISFDAGKPRSFMGDGKIAITRPNYRPETEEERIVMDVLKAGLTNYEELVDLLENQGDMSEWETLTTLKELKFRKYKRAIEYPCDFGLYNSKSAPNIKTSVRVQD
jgi:hypothetical protein